MALLEVRYRALDRPRISAKVVRSLARSVALARAVAAAVLAIMLAVRGVMRALKVLSSASRANAILV